MFVYKNTEATEYVKKQPTFFKKCEFHGQINQAILGGKL